MTTLASPALPLLLEEVEVTAVERLSPSFVRVELASPALAEFGVDGGTWDQRIKLIFPPEGREPAPIVGADEAWMYAWFEQPAEERGHMRTYTLRAVRGSGEHTRFVVDLVVHEAHGHSGPGSSWAARARVGDRIVVMAPRRGVPFGGIEFLPGTATRLLLAGDETAVPAIAAILAQLPAYARGAAFLEVPLDADVLRDVTGPAGVEVTWLPRNGAAPGALLHPAVVAHLGEGAAEVEVADEEIDPDLWETPSYSSSGEDVDAVVRHVGHDLDDLYAWIAGEAKVVTGLRRVLVNELEVDRHQVAFMGYWRIGVPMKS
ncbi:siderophore-interacting protein [Nocardioides sp. SYSU D00038]|uniref:siderophore-interacting protein n=1 Tax=Nocardioides sp. SYSU D00038 TaxID=2812554 RepID=UPI001967F5F5|nr:siderophore-interacting protein [Nocardioides sp. SYSU D00038]